MKLKSIFLMFLVAIVVFSCSDETDKTGKQQTVSNDIVQKIAEMGFNTDMIEKIEGGYVVEGDIIITNQHLHQDTHIPHNGRTSQVVHSVASSQAITTITVKVSPTLKEIGFDDWYPSIKDALNDWNNAQSAVRFVIIEAEALTPMINITDDSGQPQPNGALTWSNFPVGIMPGTTILVNLDYNNNVDVLPAQKRLAMVHALGHTLGLRHTNWSAHGEQTATQIPGTPTTDAGSVMNKVENTAPSWAGFSAGDLTAIRTLYDIKNFPTNSRITVDGAGIAPLGDIGNGAGLDFMMMFYRLTSTGNEFIYRVSFDQLDGRVNPGLLTPNTSFSSFTPGFGSLDGANIAAGNIGAGSGKDVVFMGYVSKAEQNEFKYKIGYDIKSSGEATSWSNVKTVNGVGWTGEGAGVAIGNIGGSARPDMILMAYDAPAGANMFKYRVGWDLNESGDATSWTSQKKIDGVGDIGEGASVYLANVGGSTALDIILMAYDAPSGQNQFKYKIGYDLDANGNASSWSGIKTINGVGTTGVGAGMFLQNIGGTASPELLLMGMDPGDGFPQFRVRVGWDVNTSGDATHW